MNFNSSNKKCYIKKGKYLKNLLNHLSKSNFIKLLFTCSVPFLFNDIIIFVVVDFKGHFIILFVP